MAPLQEDFVLTISDNEDDVLNLDEEELAPDNVPGTKSKSDNKKKRKRGTDEPTDPSNTTNGKTQPAPKAKKSKSNKAVELELEDVSDGDEDELAWEAQGEDDGTMNPDFDFQIGDSGAGVVEDFDGWGMGRGEQRSATGGDKKAVDIDEIIARRRGQKGEGKLGHDDAVGGEPDSERPDDFDMEAGLEVGNATSEIGDEDEEDELLAEDGFGMGAAADDEIEDGNAAASDEDEAHEGSSDDDSVAAPVPHPDDVALDGQSDEEAEEDPAEKARRDAFFAPEEPTPKSTKSGKGTAIESFQTMSLSRPVLKGLAAVGFSEPTPIQSKTIPVALLGKDVVGGAVTGSGKTAAFLVPILERLLYRPKKVPTSRVAILMPTRELAVQCYNVAKKLSMFTDISFCRLIGGFSLREQESELRLRPDVIIATPGRFIDHMRNSASFTVDTLEILVLDEADRMLEDGFADELNEILTTIPKSRQTMLFSATMTDSVDKLIRVGMTRPVRLLVDARKQTVGTLVQEFVRLRPGREDKRLAYLMLLCKTIYTERVIVFFRQKKEAHRVRVIFGLCGLKAAELHGSMSQDQRIHSVESFRSGASTHLLATDLASRGLDIKGVSTVINYEAPQSHEIYLHRVGRTARAGRTGRACTLAAEPDRKVVKAAVRSARSQKPPATVVSRVVDPAEADAWAAKLSALDDEVEAVLAEEKEERQLGQVEQQVRKGENVLAHEQEIMSRPRRTWFESEKEKARAKDRGKLELNGEVGGGKERKKGKLSGKERKRLEVRDIRNEDGGGWRKGKRKVEAEKGGKGKAKGKGKAGKAHTKGPPKGKSRSRS